MALHITIDAFLYISEVLRQRKECHIKQDKNVKENCVTALLMLRYIFEVRKMKTVVLNMEESYCVRIKRELSTFLC